MRTYIARYARYDDRHHVIATFEAADSKQARKKAIEAQVQHNGVLMRLSVQFFRKRITPSGKVFQGEMVVREITI